MFNWISVDDRLPDKELEAVWFGWGIVAVEVIVMIEGATVPTCLKWNGECFYDDDDNVYTVTHWMPLPNPPSTKKRTN